MEIQSGYCHCGCGQRTNIAARTDSARGWVRGEYRKYIRGHYDKQKRSRRGEEGNHWKGGKSHHSGGYMTVYSNRKHVLEHRQIAETILGMKLRETAIVHHVNGDRSDNRPENLVICENRAYHNLLHRRERELNARNKQAS